MKRNHSGYHRSTIYRRIKRQMKAYYEATEEPEPEVPSTSTAVGNQSPEPEMPILNSETSVGRSHERIRNFTVVAALPMDIATDLRDIIDCPPTEAHYTALKEALISRISLSTQKRLQRLISEEDLCGRKPTQLLRRFEKLADGQKLDAAMFKQLFLQRLAPSVQAILAANIPSSTVQILAETANRILEYYQPPVTVNVASRRKTAPQ
nr:unnamed protein product [Spirometra erinaceieuropaei]